MTYRSKIDLWIAVVLMTTPLVLIGLGLYLHQPALLIIATIILAGYGLAAFPVSYRVGTDCLVIRNGAMKTKIRYSEIRSMRPARSALSSPALSLDRIEIRYSEEGIVFISPADRRGFLEDVRAHAPHAEILVS